MTLNQLAIAAECLWMGNMAGLSLLNGDARVEIANEHMLGFGARRASNVGQRLAWALTSIFKRLSPIHANVPSDLARAT